MRRPRSVEAMRSRGGDVGRTPGAQARLDRPLRVGADGAVESLGAYFLCLRLDVDRLRVRGRDVESKTTSATAGLASMFSE